MFATFHPRACPLPPALGLYLRIHHGKYNVKHTRERSSVSAPSKSLNHPRECRAKSLNSSTAEPPAPGRRRRRERPQPQPLSRRRESRERQQPQPLSRGASTVSPQRPRGGETPLSPHRWSSHLSARKHHVSARTRHCRRPRGVKPHPGRTMWFIGIELKRNIVKKTYNAESPMFPYV